MGRPLFLALLLLILCVIAACEPGNDAVLREQIAESNALCREGCDSPPPDCEIKGHITDSGNRFYFLPGDPRYSLAVVEPALGEKWFCNEADATASGFRPAPRPG